MRNLIRHIFSFILLGFTLTGCYYDKESELYTTTTCTDTAYVTFTPSIVDIMDHNCNGCHNSAAPSGGIITDNYNDLRVIALDGRLWSSVSWTGNPMPKGSLDTLSVCDRTKIQKWIAAGAPNN
jgi:hypothetical protein